MSAIYKNCDFLKEEIPDFETSKKLKIAIYYIAHYLGPNLTLCYS